MVTKRSLGDKVFDWINILLLSILILLCLYPMLYVLFASVSSPSKLMAHSGLLLWPLDFQLSAYASVLSNPDVGSGYLNTLYYVVVGTLINTVLTFTAAYVLSRRKFRFKSFFNFIVVLTMFVNGGLIPGYLLVKDLGLLDSRWALILPGAISAYNMLMTRTYMQGIPASLEESAKIDGASHFTILWKIVFPLCTPIFAVITLYYAVGHWNSWFNAMIYLTSREKYPIQLILREILILNETSDMVQSYQIDKLPIADNIKYATIIVATVPILCVYPFVQKFFVKGVMIGAVKG